jgi:RNA polymerase sigma-70 factor (ECF subfamily)
LRGFLNNEAEVVQDSYVRAFTHLDSFRGEASIGTWLARIVVNEALGRLRKRRPTIALDEVAETPAIGSGFEHAGEPSPEQAIARQEIRRAIEKAVDHLPPPFRAVFMLRAVEQMSIEETASCLGIPRETVKTRLHRANGLLRRALTARFGALFDDIFPFLGDRCDRIVVTVLERVGLAADKGSTSRGSDRPAALSPRPGYSPIARLQ